MRETTVSIIPRAELAGMERDLSYTDFVVKQLSKGLADRLVQILATEGEVVVSMSDLRVSVSVDNCSVEYRRQIEWDHLVRCKDCRAWKRYKDYARLGSCAMWCAERAWSDYCSEGMKRGEKDD